MDVKMLDYLERRAKQGRNIVDRIKQLKSLKARIGKLNSVKITTVDDGGHATDFNLSPNLQGKSADPFIVHAEERMIAVFFEDLDSEVSRLEQVLAEL